jgi:Small subunit of serine palmitoyltransferase-like
MSSALEAFPLFIDTAPPEAAHYFSDMESSLHMLSPSYKSRTRRPRISIPTKVSNYVRLRYYQYEVTFGLYMLTGIEKTVLHTIIFTFMSALLYALYWGFEPFLVRTICSIVYLVTGSSAPAGTICT